MPRLLYRLAPHNGGAVFAYEDDARHVASMHRALKTARTWRELRQVMPAEEYRKIRREFDEAGEPRPRLDEAFSPDVVGGFSDGDYPPWLQAEMDLVLPDDLLEEFGSLQSTFLNDDYWHIPEENMEALADALRERGFEVVRAEQLPFH